MPEAPPWNPFDALLGSIRAERQALRAHPQDFASIVGNRLAAQAVSWSIIDGVFRSGDRARPLLRWQGIVEAEGAPATFFRDAHITACAARWDRVVAGTADGVLKLWSAATAGGTFEESALTDAHAGRITLLEFVGGNELLISADAGGKCHLWPPALGSPIATFEGHSSEVTSVAFQSGRGFVAAGARDGSVRMWHRDSDRALLTLVGHTAPIGALAFEPEGQHLVSASRDGTLRVWETLSGRCRATLRGHAADVIACSYVPSSATDGGDPRILSASTDGLVKLWTLEGRIVATLGGHDGPIRDMRMVPSRPGTTAAVTASDDGTVRVWNLQKEREERVLRGHRAPVLQAAPYGLGPRRILSVAADGGCRIWEAETGGLLREFAIGGSTSAQLSVASDGNLAACVREDGSLARIDLGATMEPPPSRVALDSTGARLLIGSGSRVRVREWRMPAAFTETQHVPDAQAVVAALWIGSSYVTLHADGTLAYWSRDGKRYTEQVLPAQTPPGQTTAIAASPDGSLLVAGDARGDTMSWRREGDRVTARASISPGRTTVNACACALNGHALAAGADGTLRLWDTTTGAVLQDIAAHAVPILDCDISHDGSMLLSASADGTLRVWDEQGRIQHHINAHADAITGCWIGSVTSRAITCSRDRTVKLWDLETAQCLETFYGDAPFVSLTVAPAGPIAAAADASGRVTVLHVLEGFGQGRQTAA